MYHALVLSHSVVSIKDLLSLLSCIKFEACQLFETSGFSNPDRSIYCYKRLLKFYLILFASTFASRPFQALLTGEKADAV